MVAQPEPMVTGDAVVLDIQVAQLPVRVLAALIDVTVVLIGYVVGLMLWALTLTELDDALSAAILIVFTVLALVGYPVVFETATRGRSLGKMALGLRVVSDDGGPERFRQALFRALAGFIEIWTFTGGPAVLCSMLWARGKRIGDVFAGTMVISERAPKMSAPLAVPPGLEWWASSLQLSGLRPEQADLAGKFLARAPQLEPHLRDQLGHRIFAEVAAQISPAPPADAPIPYVLTAVLAERHRRELARLRPAPVGWSPAPQSGPPWPNSQTRPNPQTPPAPPSTMSDGFSRPD